MATTTPSKMASMMPLNCYVDGAAKTRSLYAKHKLLDQGTLAAVMKNMPKHVYKPDVSSALLQAITTTLLVVGAVHVFTHLSWMYLPLGWLLASFAMTMMFNMGHDCAHGNWSSSSFVNNVWGEICFLLLVHPFQSFCAKHNHVTEKSHIAVIKALKVKDVDPESESDEEFPGVSASYPLSTLANLGLRKYLQEHYDPRTFDAKHRSAVMKSAFFSASFILTFLSALAYFHGPLAIVTYWLIPLILYKDVMFSNWLRFSRRGLSMHFPARIATGIPSYHLREASEVIEEAIEFTAATGSEMGKLNYERSRQNSSADRLSGEERPKGAPQNAELWDKHDWVSRLRRVNWVHFVILVGTPLVGAYGAWTMDCQRKTFLFAIAYYFFTGLGITAGYHRLWSHKSYSASLPVRIMLMLGGSGALEGSIKWWCGGHRVHHRYTDTDLDPYSAQNGFFYCHIGWMMMLQDPRNKVKADIRDLTADPLIRLQHTYYFFIGPFMAYLAPALIAHYGWNDFWGGLYFAGFLRLVFVHHSTFCVNSVAHYFGEHTYDDTRSPKDHLITAFLTLGEGYHNFHHEYPNDYRNGIRFFDYDPTKWLIGGLSILGLTFDLRQFPANEITKGKLLMKQKKLDMLKEKVVYPRPVSELPEMSMAEFKARSRKGEGLVVIEGLVHDVSEFFDDHPGGRSLIKSAVGTDATRRFNGESGIYRHSTAATHLLASFRVARLSK